MTAMTADWIPSWLEQEYCASVAAALLARTEYFELLEDAMVSPAELVQALHAWRRRNDRAQVIGGLVGSDAQSIAAIGGITIGGLVGTA